LWVIAIILLILWIIGFALERGVSAGSHRLVPVVTEAPHAAQAR
jgi:hypothetical protein